MIENRKINKRGVLIKRGPKTFEKIISGRGGVYSFIRDLRVIMYPAFPTLASLVWQVVL